MAYLPLFYLIFINLYGLFLMYLDKNKAKKNRWRISEKHLFIAALAFGSFGIFSGMHLFRHKTKHLKFIIGIPVILVLQLLLIFKYIL